MKAKYFLFMLMAFIMIVLSSQTKAACSLTPLNVYAEYKVTDPFANYHNTYRISYKVDSDCPWTSGWIFYTTLSYNDVGINQQLIVNGFDVDVPDKAESYYYYKIWIRAVKCYDGTPVGDPVDRFSYAGRDGTDLTAYDFITLPF